MHPYLVTRLKGIVVGRTSAISILLHFTLIAFNTLSQFLVLVIWVLMKTVRGEAYNIQTRSRFATTQQVKRRQLSCSVRNGSIYCDVVENSPF